MQVRTTHSVELNATLIEGLLLHLELDLLVGRLVPLRA
jgi:hypothetical protein